MGRLDVDAMLAEMSAKQFMGWIHFFAAENSSGGSEAGQANGLVRKKSTKEIECILRTKYGKQSS
jgi:hypothetical protein